MKQIKKRRNVRIAVRLDKEEKDALLMKAKKNGMSVSQLVRSAVVKIRVIQPSYELIYTVNKAGFLISQIARHCNCLKTVDLTVLKQLVAIEALLQELL